MSISLTDWILALALQSICELESMNTIRRTAGKRLQESGEDVHYFSVYHELETISDCHCEIIKM